MKYFFDIMIFKGVFKERKIENYDDIDKHQEDGLRMLIGMMIWASIIMVTIGLIIK